MTGTTQSPVALFLFNRPGPTALVFAAVRRARPAKLMLVADGPRRDVPTDEPACAAARAVVETVDWPCEVSRLYADQNLGPKRRIETGLDWVFDQAEQAIVLEDDCLPGGDFFAFCDELLERYSTDERILSISGNNFLPSGRHGPDSYYFSRYPFIWGWATWRRAWQAHDPTMRQWPALRDSGWLAKTLADPTAASYWSYLFEQTMETQHTWDYAWTLSCWQRQGLSIVPGANLVSNIGYGAQSTHTQHVDVYANLPIGPLAFPLRHPGVVVRDAAADAAVEEARFGGVLRRRLQTARARLRAAR
jgi:hypothetical protein